MWSDTISAVLSGTGLATLVGAITIYMRTRGQLRQQNKIVEAGVIERLGSTVGDFAEDVRRDAQATIDLIRRDAQATIDLIRRDAQAQIEQAVRRAETAEGRATRAEERSSAAWDAALAAKRESMEANASVRRLTAAIHSPYASIEGLRAMAPIGGSTNGKG